jgi:hypothetical protein
MSRYETELDFRYSILCETLGRERDVDLLGSIPFMLEAHRR